MSEPANLPSAHLNKLVGEHDTVERIERILQQRRQRYSQTLADDDRQSRTAHLGFFVGRQRYALATDMIESVVSVRQLTPLPMAPPIVAGLISFRGQIITVLSLREIFGLHHSGLADNNHVLLLKGEYAPGVLADRLDDVCELDLSTLTSFTRSGELIHARLVQGMDDDNRMVLHADRLISMHPFRLERPG